MKEVLMTEAGMAPERQGWFAGLKEKVRKSFTVQGAKEKFYQNNSELIAKATANLSPEDKQAAYVQIEQDALSSAKVDVAAHWGALILGTTVAGLGGALLNDKVRGRVGEMGGFGKKVAGFGDKAKDGIMRMVSRFNFRREGSSKGPINVDAVSESIKAASGYKQRVDAITQQINSGKFKGEALVRLRRKQRLAMVEMRRADALLSGRPELDKVQELSRQIQEAMKAGKPVDDLVRRRNEMQKGLHDILDARKQAGFRGLERGNKSNYQKKIDAINARKTT
jgi:hypothetical protein